MKPNKIKIILLVILTIIALVVWLRNLNIFSSDYTGGNARPDTTNKISPRNGDYPQIDYRPPRVNPFDISANDIRKPNKRRTSQPSLPPPPEKISGRYYVKGIIAESACPQAVLQSTEDPGINITTGDSLDGWIVTIINDTIILLNHGKYRDTLLFEK